jgi:glucuronoarabinoxylan endo-1,4-beta-xylanase
MMKSLLKLFLTAALLSTNSPQVAAQTRATVRLQAQSTHQRITGFGGFVCSPQFQYGHMSDADIKKVWGPASTVGCNIMRLYIPIGKNAWNQSLATAKKAKQMGLIVFASPWGQPAEWKTNGTSNAKNQDGTTGKLKRENWPDYAQYLEDYVQYLRQNGVELDAISIQNEPDWPAQYAGCLWDASEIAEFVKLYGKSISCKVMAPETLAVSDSYANALNKSEVLEGFDIYGGHQYGGIQSAYKNLAAKGKEIWMTEYLINWNEAENNTRNFDFSKDFFNFFTAINTCMLGDFNAWIHYAAKRYYGMLGDGQRGTSNGVVTKRGYVMAHFSRFVTGMTRIDDTWSGNSLESSSYLSQSGDTVVTVIANPNGAVTLTVDLPFYTKKGLLYSTSEKKNFSKTTLTEAEETCRPVVEIAAQSVNTVLFVRSRERQPSNMTGTATRFDRIDDMKTTKTSFGTNYKLSGTIKTFDSSNPLISSNNNASNGYVELDERYSQLVMHINKVTTTSSLTAGATTLTYVNSRNKVARHNYGRIDLSRGSNFDVKLDLSPTTLTDGCIGLISLTCDNAVSRLTITFGDVYFSNGNNYAATLTGDYVADDSYLQEYTSDVACTSLDMTGVTSIPDELSWWQENSNRIVYMPEETAANASNMVTGDVCHQLQLNANGGDFRPAKSFTADAAMLTVMVDRARMLMLPFASGIPSGAKVYAVDDDCRLQELTAISAHQPVLVLANGEVTFTGSGEVAFAKSPVRATRRGTYQEMPIYTGDYLLAQKDGRWGWMRQAAPSTLEPFDVYAQIDSQESFIPFSDISGIADITNHRPSTIQYFDLTGRKIPSPTNISKGQIVIIQTSDGKVGKTIVF